LAEDMKQHGVVSQGYVYSLDAPYATEDSEYGRFGSSVLMDKF